jgi:lysophospholipase L1-like esterase
VRRLNASILFVGFAAQAACGSSKPTPSIPTPVPAAPTLSCPASIAAGSLDGLAVPVTFTAPVAAGGQEPLSVTCTATTGDRFPVGSTIVTCTATDALARQASCNFAVTVTVTPRISKTRFLAFGDSITVGRCDIKPATCPPYTDRLRELLAGRYTAQTFAVRNEGVSGETAAAGLPRLEELLAAWNPEVLLLMEGTNDVAGNTEAERLRGIDGLDSMVRMALSRGTTVFLATIPPARSGGAWTAAAARIPAFNEEVRSLAVRRGVTLVDVYAAMNSDIARYVGADDLHPSREGLVLIGETFYAAIRATLDVTPATQGR